jgi:hypothetical protein
MTVTEVAERARVPRTTAYRILETLCQGGFVIRDEMDDRYRPTLAVTNLAEGAQNEAWIREGAWPLIAALGKQILWPVGIWTLTGSDLILRAATDRTSPLALNRLTSGAHLDLFESGAGQVVQAFETSHKRNLLEEIGLHRQGYTSLKGQLEDIRTRGFAFELDKETFRTLTKRSCFYCGSPPEQVRTLHNAATGHAAYTYNGIDRIDNFAGYIDGNVVPCCVACNRAKGTMKQSDFIELARKIAPHQAQQIAIEP